MALSSPARLGLTLGLLSTIGPLAIDLYLPALPAMMVDFAASPNELQRTLSVFILGIAVAQIPVGSLSDRFGRKPVLFAGVALFIIATLACAASPSIDATYALRFIQGFGICAGTIVSRAMIRDLTSGPQAARLMATSFLVIGVSPVLAPLLGSYLLHFMSWRGLFVVLAIAGLFAVALAHWVLPESLPPSKRLPRGTPILPAYGKLFTNSAFMRGALVAGLSTTVPFAYVTAAPFVLTGRFGLDAQGYSLLLGINAVCSVGMMQLGPVLMRRWGARQLLLRVSLAGLALCAAVAMALWADVLGLVLFQVASMLSFSLAGIALAPAAVTALDASSSGAGTAASALGTVQLAVTAAASGSVSLFPAFSVVPLLVIVGLSFLGTFVLSGLASLPARAPRGEAKHAG
jgi:DHA1 family bicyclomycin/chloramphenicol resistance-like MFS transporter